MVHCARFFYGPMLQGRDGIDASPCCGTGVVFSRTALVSIGGQAYGSITEDYNTSMALFGAGFTSMFLNERLVYGMAPENINDVFGQRSRWSMGALQLLWRDPPQNKPGLTVAQSLLFFEAAAYHFLAIPTIFLAIVPFIFIFGDIPPIVSFFLWEFCLAFSVYFFLNRLTIFVATRGIPGADNELWRGWQMWIWSAPNHIISTWKVLCAEVRVLRWITRKKEITFEVTDKKAADNQPLKTTSALLRTFAVTWYFWAYYVVTLVGVIFAISVGA